MRAKGVLLILLVGLIRGTELRSHSELSGGQGLFGRMAEWMLLREVYGREKSEILVREVQSCSFDFSTPFASILRSLQESCLQGLPISLVFQQIKSISYSLSI